jgi:putative phosphoribosyl transferase
MVFKDRAQAGQLLAEKLKAFANRKDVLILALPRGGVPVGFEVARALHVPLDVIIVRKLGVPDKEELAMGAIATGGVQVLNTALINALGITDPAVQAVSAMEERELHRREALYRDGRPYPSVQNQTVILIDDGLATGASMFAAARALRQLHPAHIVVAVPVASEEVCKEFRPIVDDIICATTPDPFIGVGRWYDNFSQTTDEEVRDLLARANQPNHNVT